MWFNQGNVREWVLKDGRVVCERAFVTSYIINGRYYRHKMVLGYEEVK